MISASEFPFEHNNPWLSLSIDAIIVYVCVVIGFTVCSASSMTADLKSLHITQFHTMPISLYILCEQLVLNMSSYCMC